MLVEGEWKKVHALKTLRHEIENEKFAIQICYIFKWDQMKMSLMKDDY